MKFGFTPTNATASQAFSRPDEGFRGRDSPDALPEHGAASRNYSEELDRCNGFGDIFELVKRAVKSVLGKSRTGLMLYTAPLPLHIGAYHGVGSNVIVMNGVLLEAVESQTKSRREVNTYIFVILLHEYLHALGFIGEFEVRRLSLLVASHVFGPDHPATKMAEDPISVFAKARRALLGGGANPSAVSVKLIKDFERAERPYVI